MSTHRSWSKLLSVACVASLAAGAAFADYPERPIRYLVPSSAGSAVDTLARVITRELSGILDQQVVVDNRAGAGGNIGASLAAKAPPDGYTLFQVNNNHTANTNLFRDPGYDLMNDFAPVTQLVSSPWMIVVHPSLPVKSVGELIRLAKARPDQITNASAGTGSGTFLSAELFKSQAGVKMLHVAYKGGGPALTAVVSGETAVYFAPVSTALPHVRTGKLRALGVTTAKRLDLLPEVPAIGETVRGYELTGWAGILVPARTPKAIIEKVHSAALATLKVPAARKALVDLGYVLVGGQPGELTVHMKREVDKLAKLIRQIGLPQN